MGSAAVGAVATVLAVVLWSIYLFDMGRRLAKNDVLRLIAERDAASQLRYEIQHEYEAAKEVHADEVRRFTIRAQEFITERADWHKRIGVLNQTVSDLKEEIRRRPRLVTVRHGDGEAIQINGDASLITPTGVYTICVEMDCGVFEFGSAMCSRHPRWNAELEWYRDEAGRTARVVTAVEPTCQAE